MKEFMETGSTVNIKNPIGVLILAVRYFPFEFHNINNNSIRLKQKKKKKMR